MFVTSGRGQLLCLCVPEILGWILFVVREGDPIFLKVRDPNLSKSSRVLWDDMSRVHADLENLENLKLSGKFKKPKKSGNFVLEIVGNFNFGGRGVKAKTKNLSLHNRFSFKKLYLRKKAGGGKSIHYLKALLKSYSEINVW